MVVSVMNSLIGESLDRVVYWLRECDFGNLWATGDKTLQSRISKSPLICVRRPNPFSENVVGINACSVYACRGDRDVLLDEFTIKGKPMYKRFQIPSNLVSFGTICGDSKWMHMLTFLNSVRVLDLTIYNDRTFQTSIMALPPNLVKLTTNRCDRPLLNALPQTLKVLKINGKHAWHFYVPGVKIDISHLELEVYENEAHGFQPILPKTLIKIRDFARKVTDEFPLLEEIDVASIWSRLPSIKKIRAINGDFSGCLNADEIMLKKAGYDDDTFTTYTKGVLDVYIHDDATHICNLYLGSFGIKHIKWQKISGPHDSCREIEGLREQFPTLETVSFGSGEKIDVRMDISEILEECKKSYVDYFSKR